MFGNLREVARVCLRLHESGRGCIVWCYNFQEVFQYSNIFAKGSNQYFSAKIRKAKLIEQLMALETLAKSNIKDAIIVSDNLPSNKLT